MNQFKIHLVELTRRVLLVVLTMHSFQAPPIYVVFYFSCDKVYHK